MARDTGSYTTSNLPVVDPLHTLTVSGASANNTTTLSYTTSGVHNLKVGSPVIIYGTGSASFNFNPDLANDSTLGFGTPAVVAAVTGTNTFTVKAPSIVATASVSQGTVVNDALVSNSGWDTTWLPTSAVTNVVVAREWGNGFAIQPNDDRAAQVAITGVSSNGAQVTFTVGSGHGLIAGQIVTIQGIIPTAYNFDTVAIAATGSTTITFNSAVVAPVSSYTNGAIVKQNAVGGIQALVTSAVGPYGATSPTATATATAASGATSISVATTGLNVGMGVTGTNVAANTVITAVGTGAITVNPATSGSVASAATLTFSGSKSNQYVTAFPHNLVAGQQVVVSGASNNSYNVAGTVASVASANTFAVNAPSFKILKVSGTSGSGAVGDGTNVLYYTDSAHGFAAGDVVSVYGMAPSGYNVNSGTVLTSPAPTSNTFAIANTTTTAVTAAGNAVKNGGTFTAPANVSSGADASWSSTYNYPSGQLNPALDNHDRVTNSDSGYPAFTPSYTAPNIIGLTTTNAIQKIRAAGMTPGFIQFSTDITATTVATTATTLQVTSGTAHNLSVGDTVNLSGSSNTTLNIGDAVVSSVPSTVSFIVTASGCTGTVGATALVFRPKNTVVSAQSPSAGATTATVVGFTRNYGI
jgi:hypothetical protein